MKPVLCLGDACFDLILPYAAALKAKAGSAVDPHTLDVVRAPGGSVANTACTIAKLGVPVWFAGTCGNDVFGMELKDSFEHDGVDTHLLRVDPNQPTQLVLLVLDASGDRVGFACPARGGAQHAITKEQIPEDALDQIGWLHVNGMMLREDPAASTQLYWMQRCFERGIPVSLDINARVESLGNRFFYENLQKAKAFATVIFGSALDEIPLLAAMHDAESAAATLAQNGRVVIARSGDQGAVFYRNGRRMHFPAFPVDVVDTVGAGDTFDGAYIAAILSGKSFADAMRIGNAASAICVSKPGGRNGPTRNELLSFLEQHPVL